MPQIRVRKSFNLYSKCPQDKYTEIQYILVLIKSYFNFPRWIVDFYCIIIELKKHSRLKYFIVNFLGIYLISIYAIEIRNILAIISSLVQPTKRQNSKNHSRQKYKSPPIMGNITQILLWSKKIWFLWCFLPYIMPNVRFFHKIIH